MRSQRLLETRLLDGCSDERFPPTVATGLCTGMHYSRQKSTPTIRDGMEEAQWRSESIKEDLPIIGLH